ncbi:MAG: zinc-ribbon domain-containing protein [Clostridiales bacterium]|nr:zinc-ribbon domain-containing protein [Clostridiales bacterium]
MALIKCPECGKEISSFASACIHCGFPLDMMDENGGIKEQHPKEDSVSTPKVEPEPKEGKYALVLRGYTKLTGPGASLVSMYADVKSKVAFKMLEDSKASTEGVILCTDTDRGRLEWMRAHLAEQCISSKVIYAPDTEDKPCSDKIRKDIPEGFYTVLPDENAIRCPRCGYAAITTGTRGYNVATGFVGSGKTVNRCGNCGYTWKPGK